MKQTFFSQIHKTSYPNPYKQYSLFQIQRELLNYEISSFSLVFVYSSELYIGQDKESYCDCDKSYDVLPQSPTIVTDTLCLKVNLAGRSERNMNELNMYINGSLPKEA